MDLGIRLKAGAMLPENRETHTGGTCRPPAGARARRHGAPALHHRFPIRRQADRDRDPAARGRARGRRAAEAPDQPDDLAVRHVDGRQRPRPVRRRDPVHAQSGQADPAPGERRRELRQGPRRARVPAGRRHRGAPGGGRLRAHARPHPPADQAAHRDAGRRVARSAHAADAHEAAARDDARDAGDPRPALAT